MLNRAVDFHPQRHTLTSIRSPPLQGRTGFPGPTDDHLSADTSHGVPLQQIQRPDKFTDSWPRNDEKYCRIYFSRYHWIYLWRISFVKIIFKITNRNSYSAMNRLSTLGWFSSFFSTFFLLTSFSLNEFSPNWILIPVYIRWCDTIEISFSLLA